MAEILSMAFIPTPAARVIFSSSMLAKQTTILGSRAFISSICERQVFASGCIAVNTLKPETSCACCNKSPAAALLNWLSIDAIVFLGFLSYLKTCCALVNNSCGLVFNNLASSCKFSICSWQ